MSPAAACVTVVTQRPLEAVRVATPVAIHAAIAIAATRPLRLRHVGFASPRRQRVARAGRGAVGPPAAGREPAGTEA